jgi:hypothetical protein
MADHNWDTVTIESLIGDGIITAHKDGNYGSYYPRTSEFGNQGVPFLTAKLLSDSGQIEFNEAPRLNFDKAGKLTFGFIEEEKHGDTLRETRGHPLYNRAIIKALSRFAAWSYNIHSGCVLFNCVYTRH